MKWFICAAVDNRFEDVVDKEREEARAEIRKKDPMAEFIDQRCVRGEHSGNTMYRLGEMIKQISKADRVFFTGPFLGSVDYAIIALVVSIYKKKSNLDYIKEPEHLVEIRRNSLVCNHRWERQGPPAKVEVWYCPKCKASELRNNPTVKW